MSHSSFRTLIFGTAVATLFSATASAAADEAAKKAPPLRGNDCVFFRSVYDWKELDANNLVVWAPGRRDAYHVYLTIPLYDLKFSVQIAFVDKDHDGQLCGFSSDQIAVVDSSFPQRSSITAMKKLDAAGIAELEERYKTKLTRESKKKKPSEPARETAS
jgi:hypothetical protein